MITHTYARANNKYMKEFNSEEESVFLKYLDANNLYGWAMTQPMPTDGLQWMSEVEINNWENYPCTLEVDLEYPQELHDRDNDLPMAPEHVKVGRIEKLIPNLNNKYNYVLHHKALKCYLKYGLKLTKIHRAAKYNESPWLKEYINFNTRMRTAAKNDFEKDLK